MKSLLRQARKFGEANRLPPFNRWRAGLEINHRTFLRLGVAYTQARPGPKSCISYMRAYRLGRDWARKETHLGRQPNHRCSILCQGVADGYNYESSRSPR